MRNCDPGASCRMPTKCASRRWKKDFAIDCLRQSASFRTQGGQFVVAHKCVRKPQSVDGVERITKCKPSLSIATRDRGLQSFDSAFLRQLDGSQASPRLNSRSTKTRHAVHPLGSVIASGSNSLSFVLLIPQSFLTHSDQPAERDAVARWRANSRMIAVVGRTCSQSGLRTHSSARVSDEERNVDECPPTGGKSNRHR